MSETYHYSYIERGHQNEYFCTDEQDYSARNVVVIKTKHYWPFEKLKAKRYAIYLDLFFTFVFEDQAQCLSCLPELDIY